MFLGRTVRADSFGRIFLSSQKSSQMAAFVRKSKNVEYSLNLNNLLSNKYPIGMFDESIMIYHDLSFYCGLFLVRVGPLLKVSKYPSLLPTLWLKQGNKLSELSNVFSFFKTLIWWNSHDL